MQIPSQAGSVYQSQYEINIREYKNEKTNRTESVSQTHPHSQFKPNPQPLLEDLYFEKVNQFYKVVDTLKEKSIQKRIKPEIPQFLFFIVSQLLTIVLKFLILNDRMSTHHNTYVELFSITSYSAFIYFYAIQTFQLGFIEFMRFQFHLDQIQLTVIVATLLSQYFIGMLDLHYEHTLALRLAYPVWIFYMSGTIRIQVSLYKCNRFETITVKVILFLQFLMNLLTFGRFILNQEFLKLHALNGTSAKYIAYLFFIAHALTMANYYKLYSKFDGTNSLRYDFLFQNSLQTKIRSQIKQLKKNLINRSYQAGFKK